MAVLSHAGLQLLHQNYQGNEGHLECGRVLRVLSWGIVLTGRP